MKVTTDISRLDLLKFNLRFLSTASITYKIFGVATLSIISFIMWKEGVPQTPEKWGVLFVGAIIGAFIGTLAYSLCCIVNILLLSKESNGVLGVHEYELREDGLFEKTMANETLNRWEALGKLYVAGPNLLLQVSGYLYHVFPKRCFNSDEEFYSFKKTLQDKISNAYNKTI
jgi:hypothetical protein